MSNPKEIYGFQILNQNSQGFKRWFDETHFTFLNTSKELPHPLKAVFIAQQFKDFKDAGYATKYWTKY